MAASAGAPCLLLQGLTDKNPEKEQAERGPDPTAHGNLGNDVCRPEVIRSGKQQDRSQDPDEPVAEPHRNPPFLGENNNKHLAAPFDETQIIISYSI